MANTLISQPSEVAADLVLKLLMVGDTYVGKTPSLFRYVDGRYSISHQYTIGVNCIIKQILLDGERIRLQLWDTAGLEQYRGITTSFYKGAHGFMIFYDVTNRETFINVRQWVHGIEKHGKSDKYVNLILVGNKCDVSPDQRKVSYEEGEALAKELVIPFFEASAKEDINIEMIFGTIIKNIIMKRLLLNDGMEKGSEKSYPRDNLQENAVIKTQETLTRTGFWAKFEAVVKPSADLTILEARETIAKLVKISRMGFNKNECLKALQFANGNVSNAIAALIDERERKVERERIIREEAERKTMAREEEMSTQVKKEELEEIERSYQRKVMNELQMASSAKDDYPVVFDYLTSLLCSNSISYLKMVYKSAGNLSITNSILRHYRFPTNDPTSSVRAAGEGGGYTPTAFRNSRLSPTIAPTQAVAETPELLGLSLLLTERDT